MKTFRVPLHDCPWRGYRELSLPLPNEWTDAVSQAAAARTPPSVRVVEVLLWASVSLYIVGAVLGLRWFPENVVNILVLVGISACIPLLGLLVLRRGSARAPIVITVIGLLWALSMLRVFDWVTMLFALLGVVMIVAVWHPATREHLRTRRSQREELALLRSRKRLRL